MAALRFTPDAVADRDDIWQFIAADNRVAADRVEEALFAAIVYRPENDPLQILRVLHGKRNIKRILNR